MDVLISRKQLDARMLRKGHGSHWDGFNESKNFSLVNY
jgi:hypothetical protein